MVKVVANSRFGLNDPGMQIKKVGCQIIAADQLGKTHFAGTGMYVG
jgi:hypothetical protein